MGVTLGAAMKPYYEHAGISLFCGDCADVLATLPDCSVQTCVTSPPYFGLRDYGTAEWEGGDAACDHKMPSRVDAAKAVATSTLVGSKDTQGHLKEPSYRDVCGKCGARRIDRQIGLEATPDEYVARLVAVFRAVKRVLRDDGTLWLNLGDSYAGSWGNYSGQNRGKGDGQRAITVGSMPTKAWDGREGERPAASRKMAGIKEKDLIGIPWMVAFALRADGWYLRSAITWVKGNPMPESVTDRPTSATEMIFLLTKNPTYYYDAVAIAEDGVEPERKRLDRIGGANGHTVRHSPGGMIGATAKRNKRNWWHVNTAPFPAAHFATFPPKLIEPCILAGTSQRGACGLCGAPWRRVTERTSEIAASHKGSAFNRGKTGINGQGRVQAGERFVTVTTGWEPSCACGAPEGWREGDGEIIATPTGARVGDDPSLITGRAGMNRPRGPEEGTRPITRYEQRMYAAQLRASPHRAAMEDEAGDAFAHYLRTDQSGARPIPPSLLSAWLDRGWLAAVNVPVWEPPATVPCVVLDIFAGAGTTGLVAKNHGRRFVGIELNEQYADLIVDRLRQGVLPLFGEGGNP
jgi:DNA modification methylase